MNVETADGCVVYCWYCNCLLTEKTSSWDHVVPLSRGGSERPSNLVAACRRCNSSKGNKTIPEWRLRNILAKVQELRYEFPILSPSEFSGVQCEYRCVHCRELAEPYFSEYAAFDRNLKHGQLPCYVDLSKLKRQDIKQLTLRYGPAPTSYCRHCGVNH
jgi:hypothetical protein